MGPKKGKGNPVVDGVDTSSMTREQLEAFAHKLKNEMDREREERNFFQLERDKLRTFWEITRNQLEEARAQIRNRERDVEVAQDLADIEIKNVMQQMKHLQYENQTKIAELRAEMMTQLKISQENHALQEHELLKDKRELKRLLREKEENTELQIQELKMHHTQSLSEERQKFSVETQEIIKLYEKRTETYLSEAETRHHMEINEIEERKNFQLARLIEHHEKSFSDLRNYYNDITQNNLSLISSMKEQIEEMRKTGERNKKIVSDLTAQNKNLVGPLQMAQAKAAELKKNLVNYDRDKNSFTQLKGRYTKVVKQLDSIQWECESLRMQCEKLTEENSEFKSKFEKAVLELQQKTGLKNSLLERKLEHFEKESEKREAILGEVLNLAGIEPQSFSIRIEKLVSAKNEKISDLRYELARISKAYDDLVKAVEVKLQDIGIPFEDLNLRIPVL